MPREQVYQAIIIKKQSFGEADEIVTFLTLEAGKVRALAKSVKLGTSKLQQALQPIFLNKVTLAGQGNLPKIISVQTANAFPLIQDPERIKVWFVMAELLNKALADEQKNEVLFELVVNYLSFLNQEQIADPVLSASLLKFKISLMDAIGLQIHTPSSVQSDNILFSANRGGFYVGQPASDSRPVSAVTWQAFNTLKHSNFSALAHQQLQTDQLQQLVNDFIAYQLEREIKAEKFLNND